MANTSTSGTLNVVLSFAGFICLGMMSGLLGLAAPSLRQTFNIEIADVGFLLAVQTVGYIGLSFFTGRVLVRLGSARTFFFGALLMSAALFGYVAAPTWGVVLIAAVVLGVGSGLIDAGFNAYIAAFHDARAMNLLHACFGIGLTIMPFIFLTALPFVGANLFGQETVSWRSSYAFVGALLALLAVVILLTRARWIDMDVIENAEGQKVRQASGLETLRVPLVWLAIALFFVYAGLEIGSGNWMFTFFTEGRGFDAESAGAWVSLYWGSFTVGRILFGLLGSSLPVTPVVRAGMFLAVVGLGLLWWSPSTAVAFLGVAVFGFAQAPLFPLLVLDTANRVGAEHAANAIGFQVGAAGLGIAVVPWLAGIAAGMWGVPIIAPFLFGVAVLLFVMHEASLLRRPQRAKVKPSEMVEDVLG